MVTRGRRDARAESAQLQEPVGDHHRGKIRLPAGALREGHGHRDRATTRNLHSAVNPAIKSLNYLNNILAKIEANNAGVEEAVMLNSEGYVAECMADNLFIIKNGRCPRRRSAGRFMVSRVAR